MVILILAAGLRLVDLGSNPGGLYPDEAAEGLTAQRILHEPGYRPVFVPDDGGREALFAYLVAGAFAIGGETVLMLRLTAAAVGIAGVAAMWLLARRFGWIAAITAAGWAAGSLWLICVSRDGMRNVMVPLFGALAMTAVLAWHARPGGGRAAVAGAAMALASLYTYQPLKLLPLVVLVWLWWIRRVDQETYRRLRAGFGVGAIAFLIVAAPMIAAAIADPTATSGARPRSPRSTRTCRPRPASWSTSCARSACSR